jgi:hypothetical protein
LYENIKIIYKRVESMSNIIKRILDSYKKKNKQKSWREFWGLYFEGKVKV